jgi:hypothetical protein
VFKKPTWSTIVQTSASGKEVRIALYSSPIWNFSLTFDHIRAKEIYSQIGQVPVTSAIINANTLLTNDYFALAGFMNGRQGAFDSFLYDDDSDNWIGQVQIGLGTGTSANYQAVRTIGEFSENIQNLNGTPVVAATWSATTQVAVNALVIPSLTAIRSQSGFVLGWQTPGWPNYFQCTSAGTTGSTEPNWRNAPIAGSTLTDGSVTWTNQGVPLVVYFNLSLSDWAASHSYSLGQAIKPTTNNAGGFTMQAKVAGTSGATRPSFPQAIGGTVTDGGVTWTNLGLTPVGAGGNLVPQNTTTYSVGNSGPGIITANAPTNTQVFLTSGFYFRCRFKDDTAELEEILSDVWSAKKVDFISVKI